MAPRDIHAALSDLGAALIPAILTERAIHPVFQPVVDLATGELVGAEALARGPAGTPLEHPAALFAAATHAGLLAELDLLCSTRALELAHAAGTTPPLIFVNAAAAALDRPLSPDLHTTPHPPHPPLPFRVVLDLTERALGELPAALLTIAARVHGRGNAVALDDVGADPTSLAFLPLVEPDVVKLDMHLLRNPHAPATIETATAACAYAERTGAVVLAEGVETAEDARRALALGARWAQGWYFGRPGPLSALTGRPVHPYARLRPARPDRHPPGGSPYATTAARVATRRGDHDTVRAHAEHLLRLATALDGHAVVLGAYHDAATLERWLPRLADLAQQVAYVGLSGPAATIPAPPRVHLAALPADDPAAGETTLVVVGPHTCVALCVRPDGANFVLTHDPELVHTVARTLLRRLDHTSAALGPAPAPTLTHAEHEPLNIL
jgi:EAL domain-containing protein (putative c-di-GMP-specific phosphodiesterase class I)